MAAGSDDSGERHATAPANPYTPRQIFWLKALVFGMSALMLLGIVGVFVGFVMVAQEAGSQQGASPKIERASASRSLADTESDPGSAKADVGVDLHDIELPAGATIASIALAGNRLAIHYRHESGDGIAIVDWPGGQVLSHLRIRHPTSVVGE
ncbi:MAG: hypothetical protein AAF732_18690 [Pseudomonadota bacterium]